MSNVVSQHPSLEELIKRIGDRLDPGTVNLVRVAVAHNPALYDPTQFSRFTPAPKLAGELIEKVIMPFKRQKYHEEVNTTIETDDWTVQGVTCPASEPSFAFTIGLLPKHGQEILVVAKQTAEALGAIVTIAGAALDSGHDIMSELSKRALRNGKSMRFRLTTIPLTEVIQPYGLGLRYRHPVNPEHEALIIHISDHNNLLPGEPGYDESFVQYPL